MLPPPKWIAFMFDMLGRSLDESCVRSEVADGDDVVAGVEIQCKIGTEMKVKVKCRGGSRGRRNERKVREIEVMLK